MGGEDLRGLVKQQAEIILKQAETIRTLEARIAGLEGQVVELKATIARLQKDSRNSSKPPSSDIVKPKTAAAKEGKGSKRKIGGQPGHKKHERPPFPPEQVDKVIDVILQACPACGGVLQENEEVMVKQQIEIIEKPFVVTEYHCHTYTCPCCQREYAAPAPKEAGSGLFSIRLIALAAYLKGRCHVSYRALKDFFQDVLGIVISGGFLAKQIRRAACALGGAHGELVERLKGEGHLHIDESGWKEKGNKRWIWAFRAEKYAVFIIRESRGEVTLEDVLGKEYKGIISCDFYGAYRKFRRVTGALLQFCWAHFIREVLFLLELEDAAVRRYGKRILKQVRQMFHTIHGKGGMEEGEWKERMREHQGLIVRRAMGTVPEQDEARLVAKRMGEWEQEYFRFIDTGTEPTNNPVELTIRQSVLDRAVTQGSRGIAGNEWHERFWTVYTTCGLQNVSVMNYLKNCLSAHFDMEPYPSLLNMTN
jgi:transposase